MGKKRITNKFAAVKRMISTQDQRLYLISYSAKKTRQKRKSMSVRERRPCQKRLQMILKSDKCIILSMKPKGTFLYVLHS